MANIWERSAQNNTTLETAHTIDISETRFASGMERDVAIHVTPRNFRTSAWKVLLNGSRLLITVYDTTSLQSSTQCTYQC